MHVAIWPFLLWLLTVAIALGDLQRDPFPADLNHAAIQYSSATTSDPVAQLNAKLKQQKILFKYEGERGYLRSVLKALDVPIESQMMVFSKTSVQMGRISPTNPRSLFFNDSVAVGWVHGGAFIELAAEDPKQGIIFYTLDQKQTDQLQFVRHDECLSCHLSYSSLDVPGTLVRSVATNADGSLMRQLGDYLTDDRSPFAERWGGWYVTGLTGDMKHLGNAVVGERAKEHSPLSVQAFNLDSLKGKFDTDAYLSPYSDVVALMVFEHEMHMMNLFTRVGWEVRLALYKEQTGSGTHYATTGVLTRTSRELVDYMLFADEVPLTSKVVGTSGFARKFSAAGPRDNQGRSLRQLDLHRGLMRYPCSYMIYEDAFDGLPGEARAAIYARMWEVLSGQDKSAKYARIGLADRKAIVEILRETKPSLPDYYQGIVQ